MCGCERCIWIVRRKHGDTKFGEHSIAHITVNRVSSALETEGLVDEGKTGRLNKSCSRGRSISFEGQG
jgi:hypothetical protein